MLAFLFRKAVTATAATGLLGDWRMVEAGITAPADVVSQVNDASAHADHAVQATGGDRPALNRTLSPGGLLIEGNGTDHLDAPQDSPVRTIGFLVYVPETLSAERQVIGIAGTAGAKPAFEIAIA